MTKNDKISLTKTKKEKCSNFFIALCSFINSNRRNIFLFLFSIIFIFGIFLRTYHHRDWLLFQLDQSRDVLIISKAIEGGIGELPLLGPQASGSGDSGKVYLGPVFYYFQYISALFFSDRPNVLAWPDLIFSILAIPLFYYFSRKYFARWLALSLMLIFSSSLFLITYGRFAWNPNSIPFFLLLMLIGLLNGIKKENKNYHWWIFLAAFAMSILMQLHFVTFFLAPLVFIIFLLFHYRIINLKIVLVVLGIFFVVNLPMIISESRTKGENTKNLIEAIFNRTRLSDDSSFFEKSFKSVQEISFYSWLNISSDENLKAVDLYKKKSGAVSLKCLKDCRSSLINSSWAVFLFLSSFLIMFLNFIKEKKPEKRDFLMLNLILIISVFLVITPIINDEHARFFLAISVSSFVLLGIVLSFIEKIFNKKIARLIALLFVAFLFWQNISKVIDYFGEKQNLSDLKYVFDEKRDMISPGGEIIPFIQLEKIAEFIENDSKNNGIIPIIFTADNYYARSINYVLETRGNILVENYFKLSNFDPPFIDDNVYYIVRTGSSNHFDEEVLSSYASVFKKEMGSLVVYRLSRKN